MPAAIRRELRKCERCRKVSAREADFMSQTIGYVALVVRDYDEALDYFIRVLGFELIEDTPLENDKRWVLVAPRNSQGTFLLLARAVTPQQSSRIGDQT